MNNIFRVRLLSSLFKTVNRQVLPSLTARQHIIVNQAASISRWESKKRLVFRARAKRLQIKDSKASNAQQRNSFSEWNFASELFSFESRLGEKFDRGLLKQALTDETYAVILMQRVKQLGLEAKFEDYPDNNDLASAGHDFIKNSLMEFLKHEFPKLPTELNRHITHYLMDDNIIATVGLHIGLKDLIMSKEYPPTEAVISKSFKSIVSALLRTLEKQRAYNFVIDLIAVQLFSTNILELCKIEEPWKMLQSIYRNKNLGNLQPRLIMEVGRNTIQAAFVVGIYNEAKELVGEGIGETMDIALEMSAFNCLERLFETNTDKIFEFKRSNSARKKIS